MPVAIKEWAVTVRALAEGEQLLTLRKGGIREENKHFEIEHDRFFLYPTFDHQRNDLVRQSHMPELERALEEGVWPDARAARRGAAPGRRHPAARPRADPGLGRGVGQLPDHRPARDRRALALLHLDERLRGEAAGLEAPPPASRDRPAHLSHPAPGDGQGAARVSRLPLLDRPLPRAALRGHAGPLRRRVRARVGGDRGDRLGRGTRSSLSRRGVPRRRMSESGRGLGREPFAVVLRPSRVGARAAGRRGARRPGGFRKTSPSCSRPRPSRSPW